MVLDGGGEHDSAGEALKEDRPKRKSKGKEKKSETDAMDEEDVDRKKSKGKKKGDAAKKKKKKKAKKKADPEPFLPWLHKPAKNEVLVPDLQAYECLFPLLLEWPALSFAFLEPPDAPRKAFPFATTIAVGTQAEAAEENKVQVLHLSGLRRFRKKSKDAAQDAEDQDEDGDEDEDSDSSEVYDDGVKGLKVEPRVTHFSVPHNGTVNRLASMRAHAEVVATFADTGAVHVFNLSNAVAARHIHSSAGHRVEGYALAWAALEPWLLASGDTQGRILLHTFNSEGQPREELVFEGHQGSVEDIVWSPSEPTVFASCSADRSIRFWDTTRPPGKRCAMTIGEAHEADVNVIGWNRKDAHLLASGGDDGVIKVWDLRQVAPRKASLDAPSVDPSTCIAVFTFHRGPITSLDWHPTDASMLLAASRDDSVSVWDLSVERDDKAHQLEARHDGLSALPPQLMFMHQGQAQPSEAKWHPLLPSVVFSTALEGIHIWKPSTL